ncbi:MAG: hypothetical protein E7430_05050 [Ruminococcaceae bacterium]|nr:hypothetical protein [Oscillospiraceae bacterium]
MFRKHLVLKLAIVALIIVIGAGMFASAAPGDSSDPLVSLSYINETVIPALTARLEGMVGDAKSELSDSFDNTLNEFKQSLNAETVTNALDDIGNRSEYKSVELTDGQSVTLHTGCEVLFVSGEGLTSGTLSDTTAGVSIENGRLEANHLYLCTDSVSIIADGEAELLVKGNYEVN